MSDEQPDGPYELRFSRFWYTLSPNFRGMVLMGVFAAVVSVSHTIVRALSADIHTMEIALFRAIIPLFVLSPMLLRQSRRSGAIWWRTTRPGLQLIRGVFGGLSMIAWFYALSLIPVGDATALSFTVVIFAAVGAPAGRRRGPADDVGGNRVRRGNLSRTLLLVELAADEGQLLFPARAPVRGRHCVAGFRCGYGLGCRGFDRSGAITEGR